MTKAQRTMYPLTVILFGIYWKDPPTWLLVASMIYLTIGGAAFLGGK